MFSEAEVKEVASELVSAYSGEFVEHEEMIAIKLSRFEKEVHIEWPKHDLAEVWMTFRKDGEDIFHDWFECMGPEDKAEFVAYLSSIPAMFFNHEVRIKRYGLIFRRHVLEIKEGAVWRNIFE